MLAKISGHARLLVMFAMIAPAVSGDDAQPSPWTKNELMEPNALAQLMKSSTAQQNIIAVVFPVLYRQRHILHARLAGPANKPEGLEALRQSVQTLPKDTQ